MEESIKILEEMIESAEKSINRLEDNDLSGTMRGVLELRKCQAQSMLNLINKYKKQEKIIELMAEYISIQKWGNTGSKESVIHYFEKKVGKTNGKTTRIEEKI